MRVVATMALGKKNITLILLFLTLGNFTYAQPTHFTTSDYWKHQRKEIYFGVGATNFLGDLGGLNRIGTDYSPMDLEWVVTRPAGHFGFRYRLKPWICTKSNIQYGILKGDDALTNEPARHYRNLKVRTHIFEFSQHLEFIIFNKEQFGKRFKIDGLKGMRNKNTLIYLLSGFSVFGYIPQGPGDGGWTNLRPLNTEGQGLAGGPAPYKFINYGIPFGMGCKIGLDALWRLSFELTYTKTFTDYLDDVSSVYYDNSAIDAAYGSTSAYFADPSSGEFSSWTDPGQMRGDSRQKDAYFFFNVSMIRNVTYKRSKKLKFQYRARY